MCMCDDVVHELTTLLYAFESFHSAEIKKKKKSVNT